MSSHRSLSSFVRNAIVLLAILCACARQDANPLEDLVAATGEVPHRWIEPRLSGGFRWAPLRSVTRGDVADVQLRGAAGETLRRVSGQTAPAAQHAVALAYLLADESQKAIATLTPLVSSTRDARMWSDLAAAQYTSAVRSSRTESLVEALVAADTALRIDANLPEAQFNRALVLQRLGLRDHASRAWQRFLENDGSSKWAAEARSRLKELSRPEPAFREIFNRDYDKLAGHPQEARELARRFPQESRTWGETEVMGRWAETYGGGDRSAAERHLALARNLGAEVARNHGDRMLELAVTAVERANDAKREVLALGHTDFRLGQRTYREGRAGEGERVLRRAAVSLESADSPIAYLARYFAANSAYDQGRRAEASQQLQGLLSRLPEEFPAARAQMQWQLGLCRAAETRWGEAIDLFQHSLRAFDHLGETAHATTLRELLAEVHETIGDPESAWTYRTVALRELGKTTTPLLYSVFGFLGQAAVLRRDWTVAASFAGLEIEAAGLARDPAEVADTLLRRAVIRHHLKDPGARDDIAAAAAIIGGLADAGVRSRLDARRLAAEGMTASSPAEAIPTLTKAITFHEGAGGQRMFVPGLLLYRARARRAAGDPSSARTDLNAAIRLLESNRESLAAGEQRWGVFESADAIFEEAVDIALAAGDDAGAFLYVERARARTLLETLGAGGAEVRTSDIPEGTVVVEYAVLPARTIIFVANAQGVRTASRPVDREQLRRRAAHFGESLARNDVSSLRNEGRALYRELLQPVERWIDSQDTVVFVPDATLSAVPFAALTGGDGRFVVEGHPLVVAPSASVFLRAQRAASGGAKRLLMVVQAEQSGQLAPLADAREEARNVSAQYGEVTTLSGRDATRSAFVREAPRADVIHFSGHALASEFRPADTSIVLGGRDGRMNVSQIAELRLDGCSTVVLAACSTARGRVERFEGTLSVARAFLATGVPSIVATLWPIDDGEAARFFPRLHAHLARGLKPADALRAAQLESIRTSSSPSLWAAVQVIGS